MAEGFINEMARKVAGDKALDFEGKKQAVRNAIEIYEKEIAGRPSETNFDAIVDMALAKARAQVDKGQFALARATLDKAAEDMAREEEERRERYVAGVTALRHRERDIALATYDGDAAAAAILKLARAIHGANAAMVVEFLGKEAQALNEYGRDRGSNVHLVAAIALRRELLALASSNDERGAARNNLGIALWTLGERESGTARLEEAVAAYRAALEERTRERVPLDWATTQNNLGNALDRLGERESGTARLEEAVAAYRAALEERTRERVPLDWATTQNNLGTALRSARRAGERDGAARGGGRGLSRGAGGSDTRAGAARMGEDAEQSRHCAPALGERESGTARLEEAVAAYRAALRGMHARAGSARLGDDAEQSRQRAPSARRAGERHGAARGGGRGLSRGAGGADARAGSARLGGDAEQSRHCAPSARRAGERHGAARGGGRGLSRGAAGTDARAGSARLGDDAEQSRQCAPSARRAGERHGAARGGGRGLSRGAGGRTRERVPLEWATTQNNLGNALASARRAGERHGAARGGGRGLSRGAGGMDARAGSARLGEDAEQSRHGAPALGERESGTARLEEAVAAWNGCLEVTRTIWPKEWVREVETRRDEALAEIARRSAK